MNKHLGRGSQMSPKADLPFVLAVDDFYLSLLLIKEALKGVVNLYTARSAGDALRVLDMVPIKLLLLDLGMPEMDGFEFLKQMRAMPNYVNTPVIIVSSDAKQGSIYKTFEFGVVDYVVKPFETAILCEKVTRALEGAKNQTIE